MDLTLLSPPSFTSNQNCGGPLGTFTFTNGSIADYAATIGWGDGTSSLGVITANPEGSGTISANHSDGQSGGEIIEVTDEGDGEGSVGSVEANVAAGSGSGSGADSGSGSGDSTSGSSSGSGGITGNLADDINQIGSYGDPQLELSDLRWMGLALDGGRPWDDLRPNSPATQPATSSTYSSTNGGLTTTITNSGSATLSGSDSASGGSSSGTNGSWDMLYVLHGTTRSTTTGTDAASHSVNNSAYQTYDLSWHAWGDGSGPTNYKVTEDVTFTGSTDQSEGGDGSSGGSGGSSGASGGSYDRGTQDTNDSHLMAEGSVDANNNLTSGDFTYIGDLSTQFSLTDGGGSPTGGSAGYQVNYVATRTDNLSELGSLASGSSNQGSAVISSSKDGRISVTDG